MKEKINVLIPSGHSNWVIPIINCLSYHKNYKLFLLSEKEYTAAKYSKYISYFKYHYQLNDDLYKIEIINREIVQHNISIIIPLDEEENAFFIKNSNKISDKAKVLILPPLSSYETATDKSKLNTFLRLNNFPNPITINYPSETFLNDIENDFCFPVLIKPIDGEGGNGIVKLNNKHEFKTYFNESLLRQFILQEYIDGYDIDCSVLCFKGEILTYTIQKCNILANNPYSQQLGIEFLDNTEVLNVVKRLMHKLNWSGVAHVDLRYDKNSDDYKVIEINGRFWGSIEASRAAGINFPYLVCQLTLGKEVVFKKFKQINYMRVRGFIKNLKCHPLSFFNLKLIYYNTGITPILKDPLPYLFKLKEKLKNLIS